jgi:hypothetical protein
MPAISRNAPCPCGSGKKYKRCCIDKQTSVATLPINTFKSPFDKNSKKTSKLSKKYNSIELLKIFSLLQLQPQNHGKNIRLELIVTDIVNNVNEVSDPINYEELCRDILLECKRDLNEDPPEEFFTENIVFVNGNNIVYPGISADGTEIVQGLTNAILSDSELPNAFVKEVIPGILFLLHVHTSIAQKLGHTHRYFEEITSDELSIPSIDKLEQQKNYFSFSFSDVKAISDELKISYNTIDQFVFLWQKEKINFTDVDSNPLFQKPFVFINNEFILVLPITELICINEFILNTSKKHGCLELLTEKYAQYGTQEAFPVFGRMKWKPIKHDFKQIGAEPESFLFKESLWRFDVDKLAYVTVLTEKPEKGIADRSGMEFFSKQFEKRVSKVTKDIKQKYPSSQVFLVNLTHKSRVLGYIGLAISRIASIDQHIYLNPVELHALIHNWKFDRLTLWKYAKYLSLAEDRIRFSPFNTHLSKFHWYKRNEESFFDSDKKSFDFALFEFDIEGQVRRDGLRKLDKIGIPFLMGNKFGYLQCIRKEEYYPVYISQEIHFGIIRNCLLKYACPIWLSTPKEGDYKADRYMNAALYWLNELHKYAHEFINKLGNLPISLIVQLDESFYDLEDLDSFEKTEPLIKYRIQPNKRELSFLIPIQIIQYLSTSNNLGEKYLMTFLLDALGDLMKELKVGERLQPEKRDEIIEKAIPFGNKKMLVVSTGDKDLKIAEIDLVDGRIVPNADTSYVLENQAAWLNYNKSIPIKIETKEEKLKLLNDLVSVHFNAVTQKIAEYDAVSFLPFLMKRHESLIQKKAFRKLNYPVKLSCYGQYYDVFKEFSDTESDLNEANLVMRVLVEFVACIMPSGKKIASDDDVDMLLAHIVEIANYGIISDEIKFDIQDPEIGLLPSGRIGISKRFENNTLKDFKKDMYNEEFDSYTEDFGEYFEQYPTEEPDKEAESYALKVNKVFREEWGIALFDISAICHLMASYLFHNDKSTDLIKEEQLYKIAGESTKATEKEISAFLKHMIFLNREHILKPPTGYASWEVYPWRYNRRLSYLLRPVIPIMINGEKNLLFSARHLLMAAENIIAIFYNGTLKTNKEHKKISQLLAERNNIKGKRYRNEVCKWLSDNTDLTVYDNEIKISSRGFFRSDTDKGDIDILAINKDKKIIYSIECKNTFQAKIAYDYKSEIDTYLGVDGREGLIQKHINRDIWLKANKSTVIDKLALDMDYEIQSLVISKNILPLKHIKKTEIPIFSFYEVKSGRVPL